MPTPRYLFIFDDFKAEFTTDDPPTPADLEAGECGIALIIRLADLHCFGRDGTWRPIPEGELGSAEVDEQMTPPFHAPVAYFHRANFH